MDHYADIPYMYPFTAWAGRWQPLRLRGPSGRTPELGIEHMAEHMREMMRWHEENFPHVTVSAVYEMDVTEFDWEDAGLSVVWTGDGRPDVKTEKYAAGCDVFITEGQIDTPGLMSLEFGVPEDLTKYTIDSWHTMYYAAGYPMNKAQPRMA